MLYSNVQRHCFPFTDDHTWTQGHESSSGTDVPVNQEPVPCWPPVELGSCERKSLLKLCSCFGDYYIVNITKVASFNLSSSLLVGMGTLKFACLTSGYTENLICTWKEERGMRQVALKHTDLQIPPRFSSFRFILCTLILFISPLVMELKPLWKFLQPLMTK